MLAYFAASASSRPSRDTDGLVNLSLGQVMANEEKDTLALLESPDATDQASSSTKRTTIQEVVDDDSPSGSAQSEAIKLDGSNDYIKTADRDVDFDPAPLMPSTEPSRENNDQEHQVNAHAGSFLEKARPMKSTVSGNARQRAESGDSSAPLAPPSIRRDGNHIYLDTTEARIDIECRLCRQAFLMPVTPQTMVALLQKHVWLAIREVVHGFLLFLGVEIVLYYGIFDFWCTSFEEQVNWRIKFLKLGPSTFPLGWRFIFALSAARAVIVLWQRHRVKSSGQHLLLPADQGPKEPFPGESVLDVPVDNVSHESSTSSVVPRQSSPEEIQVNVNDQKYLLDEWNPDLPEYINNGLGEVGPWMQRAEDLWFDVCEELVRNVEEAANIESWYCIHLPVAQRLIGPLTDEHYMHERGLGPKAEGHQCITELESFAPRSSGPFIKHLEGSDVPKSDRPWDYGIFKAPTENTYLRIAEYHRRIVQSRDKLRERLDAARSQQDS